MSRTIINVDFMLGKCKFKLQQDLNLSVILLYSICPLISKVIPSEEKNKDLPTGLVFDDQDGGLRSGW